MKILISILELIVIISNYQFGYRPFFAIGLLVKLAVQIFRFYCLRLYSLQPLATMLLAASALALALSGGGWLVMEEHRQDSAAEIRAFTAGTRNPIAEAPMPVAERAGADLPTFSSAGFAADFHAVAADVKLPVDEVSYTLDGGANQPFLRYRVSLTVKTGYPQIRKFIAALTAQSPNVAFDSVRCSKEAPEAPVLSCQLGFSAFYRKGGHG